MSFHREILEEFPAKETDIRQYSALSLAFLGDTVYSTLIRTLVVTRGNRPAEKLHKEASGLVCASAQAKVLHAIQAELTEEEKAVVRRGLNAHPSHMAKNQSKEDYMQATALEALCGYLYLTDQERRMLTLVRKGLAEGNLL